MTTSRRQIIRYLQENHSASAGELSRFLRTTTSNVRHHLSILEEEGVVQVSSIQTRNMRGRPVLHYSLAKIINAHNLPRLASSLLDAISHDLSPGHISEIIKKTAEYLVKQLTIDLNPTRRLYTAIQVLNQMHYTAHWEARRGGPLIIFTHCPYRTIVMDHPELCQMDAYLLNDLVGGQARQLSKLESTERGYPQCVFLLVQ